MFRRGAALHLLAALVSVPACVLPWFRACLADETLRKQVCTELAPLAVGKNTHEAPMPLLVLALLPLPLAGAAATLAYTSEGLTATCVAHTLQPTPPRVTAVTHSAQQTHTRVTNSAYWTGRFLAYCAITASIAAAVVSADGTAADAANRNVQPPRPPDAPKFDLPSPGMYVALFSYAMLFVGGICGAFFGQRHHEMQWRDGPRYDDDYDDDYDTGEEAARAAAALRLAEFEATHKTAPHYDVPPTPPPAVTGAALHHIAPASPITPPVTTMPSTAQFDTQASEISTWRRMRRAVGKKLPEFVRLRWKLRAFNAIPMPASPLNERANRHLAEAVSSAEVVQTSSIGGTAAPAPFTPPRDGESLRERYARHLRERDAAEQQAAVVTGVARTTYPPAPPLAPPHFDGALPPSAPPVPAPSRAPPHFAPMDVASAPPASPELVTVVIQADSPEVRAVAGGDDEAQEAAAGAEGGAAP